MALRYLLTVDGFTPQTVQDYQSPKSLYLYSREPLETLIKNPIYEIKSFLPFNKTKKWEIGNGIYIYKLEK
jgi:hypothetical protein